MFSDYVQIQGFHFILSTKEYKEYIFLCLFSKKMVQFFVFLN